MKLYTVTALNSNDEKVYLTNGDEVYFTPDRNELTELVSSWENNQQTQIGHNIVEVEI